MRNLRPARTFGFAIPLVVLVGVFATPTIGVARLAKQTVELGRIVPILTTVTDPQKRLITNLTKDDFEILDNDTPQPLTFFQNQTQATTVIVTIDRSASMTGTAGASVQVMAGVEAFLKGLLPQDEARAGTFSDKIQFTSRFTDNRDEVLGELQNLAHGNGTKLYDALLASFDELKGRKGRRVVVVITDGDDTDSRARRSTVIARERSDDVIVYLIGLHALYFNGERMVRESPGRATGDLAEETGGGYFDAKKASDVPPMMARVAQELHGQYLLGFSPAQLDGRVHKLTVRVKQPGMTARARRSYVPAK
jgi:Ca-activated chloride channel family protein